MRISDGEYSLGLLIAVLGKPCSPLSPLPVSGAMAVARAADGIP